MESKRRVYLGLVATAALLAVISDFLMLLVANATRPELNLPPPSTLILLIGGLLGVITIPFLGLGYWVIAKQIRPYSDGLARILAICGIGVASAGALLHGLTAFSIRAALVSDIVIVAPAEAAVASSPVSLVVWIIASLLVLVASIAILMAGFSRLHAIPRWLSWFSPAAVTVVLGLIVFPWEVGRSFLLPAAPNLAHAIFFAAALCVTFPEHND